MEGSKVMNQHYLGPLFGSLSPESLQQHPRSSPTKPKPTARYFTKQDWARHRADISHMYVRDRKTLSEIRHFMEDTHGLFAKDQWYKTRFAQWKLSKNLRADEVLALFRVEAYYKSVGDFTPKHFSRHGAPISRKNLERYLNEHSNLRKELQTEPPDEFMAKDLIETFLPSRGLVVFSPPQRFLQDEQWCNVTETVMHSFQRFKDADCSWDIDGRNFSITLLREATWKQGQYNGMAASQNHRDSAWSRIERGHQFLEADMRNHPGSFCLDILWLLHYMVEEGEFLELAYSLARYTSSLSKLILGSQSPYHAMFCGLEKLLRHSSPLAALLFKEFHKRVSEALIDLVAARVRSESADGTCNETLEVMHRMVGDSKKKGVEMALLSMARRAVCDAEFERVAGILVKMHLRDGDYVAAYPLCKRMTRRCDDIKRGIFHLFEAIQCYAALGDWEEFETVVAVLEVGFDHLVRDMRGGDILFHAFFNGFRRLSAGLEKILVSINMDETRFDHEEAEVALRWLKEVQRHILEAHALGCEFAE